MDITKADPSMATVALSVENAGVLCVAVTTKEREVMRKRVTVVHLVELLMEKRLMWLRFGLHLIIRV
ncbi:hypothetical protein GSY74_04605 [Sulfurovum sp. bin170]|uniref:hypothetical protein n=1 Tax=Sulfurovum sp. bin170 TaxID=2695268 RepID=UPI0013E02A0E|nr:hypothetical protein [Sulfurovum sp. bin170]NEW60556.1 hypothetical protein [Sulfurovum sp. bin170]